MKSVRSLEPLRAKLARAAQEVYDAWQQDEEGVDEELGVGGICQDVAAAHCDVLGAAGFDCYTMDNNGMGEQHVWAIVQVKEGVYGVDIPPGVYETGGGYTWRKRPDVVFRPDHIEIYEMSPRPEDFESFLG